MLSELPLELSPPADVLAPGPVAHKYVRVVHFRDKILFFKKN